MNLPKIIKKTKKLSERLILSFGKKFKKDYWFLAVVALVFVLNVFLFIKFILPKKEAELKLSPAPISTNYLYQSINQDYKVYLGGRQNKKNPQAGLVVGESSLSFILENSDLKKSQISQKDSKSIFYKDVYPDIDFTYALIEGGLKEEIILRNQQAVVNNPQFTFKLNLKQAIPQKDLMGNFTSTFVDPASGNYLFHFEPPFMVDAGGNKSYQVKMTIISDGDQNYGLQLEPDQGWLASALFPVIIDPTIVHDTQSEFGTGTFNRTKDVGVGATAPSIELYEQEITPDLNTVGLWHMNETANDSCSGGQDACDSSGNGNHGTATGTTIDTTNQKLGAAARSFNGSSDYVSAAHAASLAPTTAISFEAWIKPNVNLTTGSYFPIARKDANNLSGIGAGYNFIYYNGYFVLFLNTDTDTSWDCSPTYTTDLSSGQWYHLAFTKNSSGAYLYFNGTQVASNTTADCQNNLNYGAYTNLFYIGYAASSTPSNPYANGIIDEVRISNIARTPEEIKLNAQKRPYGVYTSESIDLGTSLSSLDSLQWSESITGPTAPSGWTKVKPVIIDNSQNSNTLTDYQIKLTVPYDFSMQSDFDDLRFLNSSGTNLDYWIESKSDGVEATVWIEVDSISASSKKTIFMFYGNGGASAGSNGGDTFSTFFYDFAGTTIDTAKLDYGGGTITQNEYLSVVNNADAWDEYVYTDSTFTRSAYRTFYARFKADSGTQSMIGWHDSGTGVSYTDLVHALYFNNGTFDVYEDGTSRALSGKNYTVGVWHDVKIELESTGAKYYYKLLASPQWILLYDGSYSSESNLRPAMVHWDVTEYSHTDNWLVLDSTSPEPTVGLGADIEFQTRTSANNSTWEEWRPVGTGSTAIDGLDNSLKNWAVPNASTSGIAIQGFDSYPTVPSGPTGCSSSKPVAINNFGNGFDLTNYQVQLNVAYLTGISSDFSDLRFTNDSGTNLDYWTETYTSSSRATVWIEVDSLSANKSTTIWMWYNGCTGGNSSNGADTFQFFDDFTGANGSALDTGKWTSDAVNTVTASIQSNKYRVTDGTKSGETYWIYNDTDSGSQDQAIYTLPNSFVAEWDQTGVDSTASYMGQVGIALVDSGNLIESYLNHRDGHGAGIQFFRDWIYGTTEGYETATSGETKKYKITRNASTTAFYIDNNFKTSGTMTGTPTKLAITIGAYGGYPFLDYVELDNLRVRKYATVEPIAQIYNPESQGKMEGTGSLKSIIGAPQLDVNTAGLWHMEETSGTGAYIKDSTANANHGTPTGTTLIDGFYGKARNFDGSNDVVNFGSPASLDFGNNGAFTFSGWVKPTTLVDYAGFVSKNASGRASPYSYMTTFMANGRLETYNGSAWADLCPAGSIASGNWYHVAFVYNGTTIYGYVNGAQCGSAAFTYTDNTAHDITIGSWWAAATTYDFNGLLDEVKISNIARTAEEIAEAYRAGRDHRLERTLSSTDLSPKNKVPFYVAADRPGTYLETYIGETSNSVYGAYANTVGLWHLDEVSGSAIDSSGNNNTLVETSGTIPRAQGKIGKAADFELGDTEYLSIADASCPSLNITGNLTISAWVNSESSADDMSVVSKWDTTAGGRSYVLRVAGGGSPPDTPDFFLSPDGTSTTSVSGNTILQDNTWYHLTAVYDGSYIYIYVNGALDATPVSYSSGIKDSTTAFNIGSYYQTGTPARYFDGLIDEVMVLNQALSADEIRQLYQYGLRTHQITVDYSTTAGADGPSSTSDYSFTPDSVSGLYTGDTVIVRENVDGTTYIMQGEVTSISSGLVTVSSWSGTAPPSTGYSTNADVFKWQREYWDITDISPGDRDAIIKLGLRVLDGSEGFDMYLDDFRSNSSYMTDPTGSSIDSTPQRYFQYRAILTTNDTLVSPSLTSVTLNYTTNNTPSAPTSLLTEGQTNPSGLDDTTPEFSAIYNDADIGDIANKYRIQVDDDSEFGSPIWDSGESGTVMSDCIAGNLCSDISYAGSALTGSTTYYWRIKYWDDEPVEGDWSTEEAYFSVNATPSAPTSLQTEELTNPSGVTDTTPEFSAVYNDDDVGDIANYYQIQVDDDPVFGSTLWDSTKTSLSPTCTAGNRCTDISYGGTSSDLQWNTKYYWRIKYWDDGGAEGAWSTESAYFTMTIMYPPTSCMIDDSSHPEETLIKWADNTSLETGYRIERSVDSGEWTLFSTEAVNTTSKIDNTTEADTTYKYRVRANSDNGNSQWCQTEAVNYGKGTFYFQ